MRIVVFAYFAELFGMCDESFDRLVAFVEINASCRCVCDWCAVVWMVDCWYDWKDFAIGLLEFLSVVKVVEILLLARVNE